MIRLEQRQGPVSELRAAMAEVAGINRMIEAGRESGSLEGQFRASLELDKAISEAISASIRPLKVNPFPALSMGFEQMVAEVTSPAMRAIEALAKATPSKGLFAEAVFPKMSSANLLDAQSATLDMLSTIKGMVAEAQTFEPVPRDPAQRERQALRQPDLVVLLAVVALLIAVYTAYLNQQSLAVNRQMLEFQRSTLASAPQEPMAGAEGREAIGE